LSDAQHTIVKKIIDAGVIFEREVSLTVFTIRRVKIKLYVLPFNKSLNDIQNENNKTLISQKKILKIKKK